MKTQILHSKNECGGFALATVIIVMAILGIIITLFFSSYSMPLVQQRQREYTLQRIANSRAGILRAQAERNLSSREDTLPLFPEEMVPKLWKNESYGTAQWTSEGTAFTVKTVSEGEFRGGSYTTLVEEGSQYALSDTVLFIQEGVDIIAPAVTGISVSVDSLFSEEPLVLRRRGAEQGKQWVLKQFGTSLAEKESPAVIRRESELESLPDTVQGHLLIDGNLRYTMALRTDPLVINGDLQITGSVELTGLNAVVTGEVRLNDRTKLTESSLIVQGKLFLAEETWVSGSFVSLDRIEIFDQATVGDQSLLLVFHESNGTDSLPRQPQSVGAITLRDAVSVAASLVVIGGGIVTEGSTESRGVILSDRWIQHEGTHTGMMSAPRFVSPLPTPVDEEPIQEIAGAVAPPFTKEQYPLPWFIGTPKRLRWVEFVQ